MHVYPAPLEPGSVVRVIAPASPFEPRLVWRGLGWLSERYRVRWDRGIFERAGYLAGSDDRRRAELSAALDEPDVAALFCARGGYGASRYIHQVDWTQLARGPRWIVGFSDVTALHLEASAQGVASLHAHHVTALGRGDAGARDELVRVLEAPHQRRTFTQLETIARGRACGPVVGGNLTLLHACAAAGRLELPPGALLLIEDVTERPYRIDRMLTTLVVGGHLDRIAGVVVGDFHHCDPGVDGVTVRDVVSERLQSLAVPAAYGAPVGHGVVNRPVILGGVAELEATADGATLAMGDR